MNNWFSSPSNSQTSLKPDGQPKERPTDTSKPKSTRGDTTRNRTDQQTQPGLPFVPVLSTPHDTILSELSGRSLNVQPLSTGDIVRSEDALSVPLPKPSIGSLEHADGTTSPTGTLGKSLAAVDLASVQIGPSNATSPIPGPSAETNPIYDPFTGQSMGFLPAHSSTQPRSPFQTTHTSRDASRERSETLQSQGQFEQAKEDLWNHVGKVRKLQSEIAGMHIELEGIGQSGDTFGVSLSGSAMGSVGGIPKRPSGPGGRLHEDTIGGSEQWYDPEESEKERKRAMDAEFNTLAETFEGRAGKINGIMDKVRRIRMVQLSPTRFTYEVWTFPISLRNYQRL
ncbi:hypothetical protein NLI96_g8147 [Meripilus lineatus]|uniref:Uncharacterized protein n=1 Tax=Meripilus lineatus TaxID=2056292 RepID=A0AAD5UXV4_9APHY|nr:hypothetical protein NLI96_g8147 [Physisporinus lineatus]